MKQLLLAILFFVLCFHAYAEQGGNKEIASFSKAKKIAEKIYIEHRITLYCGCKFFGKVIDLESCNYQIREDETRAKRLEWEHVVPAWALGHQTIEWKYGHEDCKTRRGKHYRGRKCATKKNKDFKLRAADLYNLYPSVGEVNGNRSSYKMGIIPGEEREYGSCDVEINLKTVEPREQVRGEIARTYFYMNKAYPGYDIISSETKPMFDEWNISDPVDFWECKRAKKIEELQGNANEFVKIPCKELGLY